MNLRILCGVIVLSRIVVALTANAVPSRSEKNLAAPPKPSIREGYYLCYCEVTIEGEKKLAYEGTVTVSQPRERQGIVKPDVYLVQWSMGYAGIGTMEGNSLVVGFGPITGTSRGVAIFRREEDDKWQGRQLMLPGDGEFMPETWEYMRPLKREDKK